MYKYFLAALLVFAAPSLASANGGGNSKGRGAIEVRNTSSSQVLLVAVDPSDSLLSSETSSQFTNRGGRIVNPGGRTTFKSVSVGTHELLTILANSSDTSVDPQDAQLRNVTVSRNRTTQVSVGSSSSTSSN